MDKPYRKLLDHLAEVEHTPIADLPKEMQDTRLLQAAWLDGVVEFGRKNVIETGEKSPNSARAGTYYDLNPDPNTGEPRIDPNTGQPYLREISGSAPCYIVEPTYNWTGHRKTWHKTLKDLLAEPLDLKPGAAVYVQGKDGKRAKTQNPAKELGLVVRVTDKGFAALAA